MIDYIKFWMAKAMVEFLIFLAIIAVPLVFICAVVAYLKVQEIWRHSVRKRSGD